MVLNINNLMLKIDSRSVKLIINKFYLRTYFYTHSLIELIFVYNKLPFVFHIQRSPWEHDFRLKYKVSSYLIILIIKMHRFYKVLEK